MSIGIFPDIVMICIVLLVVYVCARRGFVRLTLSVVSIAVAAAVAVAGTGCLAPKIAQSASPAMERFIVHQTSRWLPDEDALDTIVSMSDKVVTVVRAVLEKMDSGEDTAGDTGDAEDPAEEKEPLAQLAYGVSLGLYGFLLFCVLFALVLAVLRVLIDRLEFIERIPIVGTLDTTLGILCGAALGVVVLFLPVFVLVTLVPRVFGSGLTVPEDLFELSRLLAWTRALYPFG